MSGIGRSGSTSMRCLDPVRHELVAEQDERGVEQRPERGGAALMLLLPREAQQVLARCSTARSASSRMTREGLAQGGRHVGHLGEEVREADDRGERVVEVVRDAGDELADGGHLFRLDELVLQTPPLRLIIEQEHEGGAVGAANRHGGNRIGPLAGAQVDLAARSLLFQGPLQIGRPFGRNEGLPGPADQARRAAHSPGRQTRGWPGGSGRRGPRCRGRGRWRPPPPARSAGRRRGGPPAGRSRARCWPGRPGPRSSARATAVRSGRARRGWPRRRLPWPRRRTARAASDPAPSAWAGGRPRATSGSRPSGRMSGPRRSTSSSSGRRSGRPAGQACTKSCASASGGRALSGDLGGREALPDVAQQQVDDRGAAEGARQLLTEDGDPAKQRQVVGRGRRRRGWS